MPSPSLGVSGFEKKRRWTKCCLRWKAKRSMSDVIKYKLLFCKPFKQCEKCRANLTESAQL